MKTNKLTTTFLVSLVLGSGFFAVQPARAQAPTTVFQYAALYNGLMEFTDCAPMTINGRVHCNSNIYYGCPTGSSLSFNSFVTCSGAITNPAWDGFSKASYTTSVIYNGTPSPGFGTGYPVLQLPTVLGSYREMINLPPPGANSTNDVNFYARYFNKANLVILVTNITTALDGTNVTSVLTSVWLKSGMLDTNPLIFSYTNNLPTNTLALYSNWFAMSTNWAWFGASNWLTTNSSFYDARQMQTNHVTQIDIGRFGAWIATNTNALAKWNAANPFNGIIYVGDFRTTNSMFMDAVRLTNGQTIPSIGASNSSPYTIAGLTVASINPLYVHGLYNCPSSTNVSSTNTTGYRPCSLVGDALTLLSPNWQDNNSWAEATGGAVPVASTTTVNAAIIAGNVPSTGTTSTQYSGGVQNLLRLLENWSGQALWLNTSFVNLYASAQATAQFQQPTAYYSAPTRNFSFDQNFSNVALQPPGVPAITRGIATVSVSNLNQVYDGTPKAVTVTTMPAGLGTLVYYGSGQTNTTPPTAPGSYAVLAGVNDLNWLYVGSTTNLLVISKAAAAITFSNLTQTYDGAAKPVSATTSPTGLSVKITYNGFTNSPTNAGSYTVVATVVDTNYAGSITNTLVINRATATINVSNLSQTFDGTPKSVSVTTIPADLAVNTTYNGSSTAPTNTGSYTVICSVNAANYQGSVTNTLVIAPPAPTPITLSGTTVQADGTFQLSFTNTPGASFTVLGSMDPTAPLTNWTVLGTMIENPVGQFQFTDLQATNSAQQFYIIRSP